MKKKRVIFIVLISALLLVLLLIYSPKPSTIFVKKKDINKIEYVCYTSKYYGVIEEENYDILFDNLNESYIFTRLAQIKQMSADRIIIYYNDGSSSIISSTHVGTNVLFIYKNTFDFSIMDSLVSEKIPLE